MNSGQADIRRLLNGVDRVASVTVTSVKGSAPREEGAWMLATAKTTAGTIGGGQLEYMAIDAARALLHSGDAETVLDIPLGPEIGQCCGGRVVLQLRRLEASDREAFIKHADAEIAAYPAVYVFGAGHLGHALIAALCLLPVRPLLIDTRREALEAAPDGTEVVLTAMPEAVVREAEPESGFVIVTHDHALDFLIVKEALQRGDARYVGMIGSKSKRKTFERWYIEETGKCDGLSNLISPIGSVGSRDKRPAVIASFAAAEIMAHMGNSKGLSENSRTSPKSRQWIEE